MTHRTVRFESQQHTHRNRIRQRAEQIDAVDFFNVLSSPELLQTIEAHLPEHRERLIRRR